MTLARTTRAGTRNLVREEIKRVKKQLEKVRKWEKKWVVLEECGLKVYRWVPKPVTQVTVRYFNFSYSHRPLYKIIQWLVQQFYFQTEENEKKVSPLKAALKQNMTEKYAAKAPPKEEEKPAESKETSEPKKVPINLNFKKHKHTL